MSEKPGQERSHAPPQYSPDGKWWWDGHQWRPTQAQAPHHVTEDDRAAAELKLRVPRLSTRQKIVGGGAGGVLTTVLGFIVAMFQLGVWNPHPPPTPSPPIAPVASVQPTRAPGPSAVWNVILIGSTNYESYNNYVPNEPDTHHYIVVNMSFENVTSEQLVLSDRVLDLRDSSGQHYSEGQATDPGRTFAVGPGQTVTVTVAYVIPDTACHLTLALLNGGTVQKSWTIDTQYSAGGCS